MAKGPYDETSLGFMQSEYAADEPWLDRLYRAVERTAYPASVESTPSEENISPRTAYPELFSGRPTATGNSTSAIPTGRVPAQAPQLTNRPAIADISSPAEAPQQRQEAGYIEYGGKRYPVYKPTEDIGTTSTHQELENYWNDPARLAREILAEIQTPVNRWYIERTPSGREFIRWTGGREPMRPEKMQALTSMANELNRAATERERTRAVERASLAETAQKREEGRQKGERESVKAQTDALASLFHNAMAEIYKDNPMITDQQRQEKARAVVGMFIDNMRKLTGKGQAAKPASRKEYFDVLKKRNPTATDEEINRYLDEKGIK